MTVPSWTVRKAVSYYGKPHQFQRKSYEFQADRSLAAEVRHKPQLFLCRRSSCGLGITCLGVVASVNEKQKGERLGACLTSLHANEKILGLCSVSAGVFLGRRVGHLAWYIMHSVCPNVVYEVFCVYLFLEIWDCLLGLYSMCL